ncbi:sterol desaturase family protein [Pseudodesulfovibrio sp.]|nr:sterol desaturase family protein [Pseudodesulfovibrio sp.]
MTIELAVRVGSFLAILTIMGIAESVWPRRVLATPKGQRWFANISVSVLSTLIVRILLPLAPAGIAIYCAEHGIGLLNLVHIPFWLAFMSTVQLLDMLIYWQHVLFHRIPILWRIHRMHHADTDIDASTGIRFHPIEIALSMLIKISAIILLGPPASAVIVFEILLNGCALFNHANVRLPVTFDALLRLIAVTPDMHRVHHSTDMREANMNYGFNFPWWDRLFGTYKDQPDLGHTDMRIGLNIFRDPEFIRLTKMLTIPFK